MKYRQKIFLSLILIIGLSASVLAETNIRVGAKNTPLYFPLLANKKIGLVVNQTSMVDQTHLLDFLIEHKLDVKKIYCPEHGFRGDADAGAKVDNSKDPKTGLPIMSLYGKTKKPSPDMLQGIDVMVFDIQDVGIRFYTYISTLHYVMEACAEQGIPLIVLDRPNPNGDYVDGPVLDTAFRSFVGMDPIPVVHGLTVGELAFMINGESWLKNGVKCNLRVIPTTGWSHDMPYSLPIKPSPNLPNDLSIRIYPSICYFEPTVMSIGRGTPFPFQCIGNPDKSMGDFTFTPKSTPGMSNNPKHKDVQCYGYDLRTLKTIPPFTLKFLIEAYKQYPDKKHFFTSESMFNHLAGNGELIKQIRAGDTEEKIKASWEPALSKFKTSRLKYLIYP